MKIIPLSDYPDARRPYEHKSRYSWTRDARAGKIPGAFRFKDGGDWYVDLDIHDEIVKNKVASHHTSPPEIDDDTRRLAQALGISDEDLRIGSGAV